MTICSNASREIYFIKSW